MDELYLAHSGKGHDENPPGRGSGRYPWGSGNRKHQHDWDVKARMDKLAAQGMSQADIAKAMGYTKYDYYTKETKPSISKYKAERQIAVRNIRMDEFEEILWYDSHKDPETGKPYTNKKIAELMGLPNESSVRTKRNNAYEEDPIFKATDKLKQAVKENGYLDVGKGTELYVGLSPDSFKTSLEVLRNEGYEIYPLKQEQNNNPGGNKTTTMVLIAPNKVGENDKQTFKDAYEALKSGKISRLKDDDDVSNPLSQRVHQWEDPIKVPLKKIEIKYDEEGGTAKDGIIEIRAVKDKDGNIVAADPSLNLGTNINGDPSRYAQVRIMVDGGKECITEKNPSGLKYIKGMAVYNLNLKEGTDILVNSNKSINDGVKKALKDIEPDENLPFGSSVVQQHYIDPKTGKEKLSAIQLVGTVTDDDHDRHTEGAWGNWSKNLPSQFLAKQNISLVKKQLKADTLLKEDEFETIMSIKNPTVRKKLLVEFGDGCDKAAEDLKAAPIPGQRTHVLIASKTLKDNECYAPNYDNGQTLALVRFPHAGPFEIPVVKVNNNNKEMREAIGKNALDAIGVNWNVASRLSGADFDGDNVIAIPMTKKSKDGGFERNVNIKSSDPLKELVGYDTNIYSTKNPRFKDMVDEKGNPTYKYFKTDKDKGKEMGVITNLIMDMQSKGCEDPKELVDAVRYSMIVIDAKKHELNYKQAYKDYHIADLKKKYQTNEETGHVGGASSLLTRAKSPTEVDIRSTTSRIDPETGKRIYDSPKVTQKPVRAKVYAKDPETGKYLKDEKGNKIAETYQGKYVKDKNGNYTYVQGKLGKNNRELWEDTGKVKDLKTSITKMQATDDARTLLSSKPNEIEKTYADYANHMKSMANAARKESVLINPAKESKADPIAAKEYSEEVASLNAKLVKAKKNSSREREAQRLCTSRVNAAKEAHPEMYQDYDTEKKLRDRMLKEARIDCNAQKDRIKFTEKEWEAIEHNAISPTKLLSMLENADTDSYKSLALPKSNSISTAKKNRIKALYNNGYSQEEIARMVDGVSTSSISNIINS